MLCLCRGCSHLLMLMLCLCLCLCLCASENQPLWWNHFQTWRTIIAEWSYCVSSRHHGLLRSRLSGCHATRVFCSCHGVKNAEFKQLCVQVKITFLGSYLVVVRVFNFDIKCKNELLLLLFCCFN